MKKFIYLFTLVLAIGLISGNKPSAKNEMTEKNAKSSELNNLNDLSKADINKSKEDQVASTQKKEPEERPKILLMINNDTGLSEWSPALWWGYHHANSGKPGC